MCQVNLQWIMPNYLKLFKPAQQNHLHELTDNREVKFLSFLNLLTV